jgi:hypothetical protein
MIKKFTVFTLENYNKNITKDEIENLFLNLEDAGYEIKIKDVIFFYLGDDSLSSFYHPLDSNEIIELNVEYHLGYKISIFDSDDEKHEKNMNKNLLGIINYIKSCNYIIDGIWLGSLFYKLDKLKNNYVELSNGRFKSEGFLMSRILKMDLVEKQKFKLKTLTELLDFYNIKYDFVKNNKPYCKILMDDVFELCLYFRNKKHKYVVDKNYFDLGDESFFKTFLNKNLLEKIENIKSQKSKEEYDILVYNINETIYDLIEDDLLYEIRNKIYDEKARKVKYITKNNDIILYKDENDGRYFNFSITKDFFNNKELEEINKKTLSDIILEHLDGINKVYVHIVDIVDKTVKTLSKQKFYKEQSNDIIAKMLT